jgi:hypothetical protein
VTTTSYSLNPINVDSKHPVGVSKIEVINKNEERNQRKKTKININLNSLN